MRKFYHLYVPSSIITDFFGLITFVIMISGSLAAVEYGHLLETPGAEQSFNIGIWLQYATWLIEKTGDNQFLIIGMIAPLLVAATLTLLTHKLPDIKMFRRAVPLND